MERRLNPAYADFPLHLSEEREIAFLRKTGLAVDHVPALGELIYLRDRPNEDEATEFTDRIHSSYVTCVERALSLMPSLVWCGADLIIPEITAPATCENCHLVELNTPARFVDHHHPWRGQSRDVASLILDRLESWN